MKKFGILALIALFTMGISVSAQDATQQKKNDNGKNGPREMRFTPAQRAERMAKQLDLTADQKAQLEKLFEKQDAQRAEQMSKAQDQKANREEMRAQREKEMQANDAELEKIIGKEKMDQWKATRAQRMQNMRNGNSTRSNGPAMQ